MSLSRESRSLKLQALAEAEGCVLPGAARKVADMHKRVDFPSLYRSCQEFECLCAIRAR